MRALIDRYNDRLMIGEIYLPIHKLVTYYGTAGQGAHLPFNFMLISLPWDARKISTAIDEYESALPENAWPNWVIGNHDQPRITSRVGINQSKIAAMLLLTLRGTPTMYYGDEIAMRDVPVPLSDIRDPQGLNMPGKNLSRDPARTPMQWDNSPNGGFSIAKPWLQTDKRFHRINVASEMNNPYSNLTFFKRLIDLRQSEKSLMIGDYKPFFTNNQMMAYYRKTDDDPGFLIVLNLSHRPCYFLTDRTRMNGKIILATSPELEGGEISEELNLSGDEGVIIKMNQ
jgi:alpha-glucosidase